MRESPRGAGCGSSWGSSSSWGAEVLRCGELEKRSGSLWQTWKKKRVVLSRESLSLFPPKERAPREKALGLGSIAKVDCVERTGKYLYFTLVTTDRREIDFRCPGSGSGSSSAPGWNASIALALIDFQNQRALRALFRDPGRSHPQGQPREEEGEEEEQQQDEEGGGGETGQRRRLGSPQRGGGGGGSSYP